VINSYYRHRTVQVIVKSIPQDLIRRMPSSLRENIKNRILREFSHADLPISHVEDRRLPHLTSPSVPTHWRPQIKEWLERKHLPAICIVIHAYHLELLDELLLKLVNIELDFDVVLTNSSGEALDQSKISSILSKSRVKDILLLKTQNRGRDILPLIHCVNAGVLDEYLYIFKFHTKKSEWAIGKAHIADGMGGSAWRQSFLDDLIGDGKNFTRIVENLEANTDLGIVTAENSLLGSGYWTSNFPRAQQLARRIELDVSQNDLLFPAGSMYACKALIIQGLRALCLSEEDFEIELGINDGTTAHAIERLMGIFARAGGYQQDTVGNLESIPLQTKQKSKNQIQFIAYYLPQFHPEPLNDLHWGKNFTEWNNVTRATPQFAHHLQPLLPTDLGFYNLEIEETVLAQENLAQKYGVTAFMYYYYNFGEFGALEKPMVNRLERTGGLPFSFIWVNENWSRNWDGLKSDLIAEQQYLDGWEIRFLESTKSFLLHPDFLRDSENRPIFSIYRPSSIPNIAKSIALIREYAVTIGIGALHILFADTLSSFPEEKSVEVQSLADGIHAFPPHGATWVPKKQTFEDFQTSFMGQIYSYNHSDYIAKLKRNDSTYHLGVLTRFDNTPRRASKAHIIYGSNPYVFRRALLDAKRISSKSSQNDNFIFINAWNEWAEGAILEPSNRFGRTYLQALREIESL
jgi:lipopolysaccharide biosynthesis protein